MKKLSIIAAGAALLALALGGPAAMSTAAAATHGDAATQHVATSRGNAPSTTQIAALFDRWNAAVETGDAEKVADLYAPDAVLLPTLSPQIRTTRAGIVDYFEHFLARHPSGQEIRSVVKVLDARSAIDTGIYRFTFHNADGTTDSVDARYTFVYEKRDGQWWIINHHSSLLPAAS
ncbi:MULTISPECIES: SgcJ/EcaC family oxidoreductase [Nocardioides]|uniref:SgcJ/EcaC family oxidoreductase n=1 Tax=Nocardioides vastitatis TaxID=2568655 RepID=A0ABW0ZHT3_9ACTN|nr:SgcJ/EcaC family oxidoreductase [Nocardioides sp.]THI97914.1 SgcJ/EcaC family oxidoreductase [Nocardioides sp.]